MLQERSQWPVVAELITSEQLPPQRVAEISAAYPDFATWLMLDGAASIPLTLVDRRSAQAL
jgi:hypothetical protein